MVVRGNQAGSCCSGRFAFAADGEEAGLDDRGFRKWACAEHLDEAGEGKGRVGIGRLGVGIVRCMGEGGDRVRTAAGFATSEATAEGSAIAGVGRGVFVVVVVVVVGLAVGQDRCEYLDDHWMKRRRGVECRVGGCDRQGLLVLGGSVCCRHCCGGNGEVD